MEKMPEVNVKQNQANTGRAVVQPQALAVSSNKKTKRENRKQPA